ncbi:MAG TPA: SRPBCC family protein [Acidiferrobacterales bacterium]|jgi:uncharacterized protein YndB with AHSA1/START domain
MTVVEAGIRIQAPRERIFDISQDYAIRKRWDPFSRATGLLDDARWAALGVRAFVRARNGFQMTFKYVQYRRPERAAIVMIDGPWFFEKFAGTWIFEPAADGGTLVRFRYSFVARPVSLRSPLEELIRRVLQRNTEARLPALKRYCESQCAQAPDG